MSNARTVEEAHPGVLVGGYRGTRLPGVTGERMRQADDYEDLESLPLDEQVSVVCSIKASDRPSCEFADDAPILRPCWTGEIPVRAAARDIATVGHLATKAIFCETPQSMADLYGETECRLRTKGMRLRSGR